MRHAARWADGRTIGACVAIAVCAAALPPGPATASVSPDAPAVERGDSEVLASLACEAGRAYASRDLATLERLSADDYVQTDVRGVVSRRKEWLQFVKKRPSELTVTCEDVAVRIYGSVAVVTGGWIYTAHQQPKDLVTHSRWTSVWTRETDGWKRHVFQNTYVNLKADRCAMGLPH
ncbi:MAG TPA: nuclear transport factor 2 family protein [Patescibacteria group bacterium]|nr:nuclear transport factor 2 family protein [Patescibacteria group bacterium]